MISFFPSPSRSATAGLANQPVSPVLMLRTCWGDATGAVPPSALHDVVSAVAPSASVVLASCPPFPPLLLPPLPHPAAPSAPSPHARNVQVAATETTTTARSLRMARSYIVVLR